jgi:Flp pilus assembly protein TadG
MNTASVARGASRARRPPDRPRRSRRARSGAAIVEASLVISVAFLFLFAIFEYSRLFMTLNVVENAARAGARHACVQFTANRSAADIAAITQEVEDFTIDAMGGVDRQLEGIGVEVLKLDPATGADAGSWNNARFSESIAVRVTGTYRPGFRLFMPATLPIRIQAFMASEAN